MYRINVVDEFSMLALDFTGIIVGAVTFLTIGLFHPIVIKAEYHWGVGCWWIFLTVGLGCIVASSLLTGTVSIIFGVVGFSSLWSILELVKQRKRVDKGWFPEGPGHN